MQSTLTHYLDNVTRFLSPELLSPSAKEKIYGIARSVSFGHLSGFECRLRERASQVDFQMGYVPGVSLPPTFLENSVWRLIDSYGSYLLTIPANKRPPLKIILEFDCDQPDSLVPIPSVFLALKKMEPENSPDVIAEAEQLLQESVPCKGMLGKISTTLPDLARVSHLGFMLSRPDNAVRVNISGLGTLEIPAYLKTLGWKSDTAQIEEALEIINPVTSNVVLAIDLVDERVSPRLGLELFINFDLTNPIGQWNPLLDLCVSQSWCTMEKAAGLKNWIGVSQPISDAEKWPSSLKALESIMSAGAYSFLYRYINHFKLIIRPDYPVEAKAYLGFAHRWLDKQRIRDAIESVRNQTDA